MGANSAVTENTRLNLEEIRGRKTNLRSKPLQFNIDLTGRCNVNPPCVFCALKDEGYKYEALDISLISKYSSFLSRCRRLVDCSFGEPLTHPDFLKLVQQVAENGQSFNFATNGLLLTPDRADVLATAGQDIGFSVSINAATAETYYKLMGQRFDRVIENVRYFIKKYEEIWGCKPPIALNFIVMKANRHEVLDFMRMAGSLGIKLVNLRHLFKMNKSFRPRDEFGYRFIYDEEILPLAEYQAIGNSAKELARELDLTAIIHWESSDSAIADLSEQGIEIPCLFPWKFLFVQEHSGNVYMCCYSSSAIGNVGRGLLEEIWNGDIIVKARECLIKGELPDFCKEYGASCPLVVKGETNRRNLPDSTSRIKDIIIMGENDDIQCLEGWHALENFPPLARWTSGRAAFELRLAERGAIMVEALSHYPLLTHRPISGRLEIEGEILGRFTIENERWRTLRFPILKNFGSEVGKIWIIVQDPWVPANITASLDERELGIAVHKIWLE